MPDNTPPDDTPPLEEICTPSTPPPSTPPTAHSLRDLPVIRMSDLYRGDHTGQLFRVELSTLEDMMMYLEYLKPGPNEPGLMEVASPQEIADGADVPKAITPAQLKKSLLVQGGAIIDQKLAAREAKLLQRIRTLETTLRDAWTEQQNALETRINDRIEDTHDTLHTEIRDKTKELQETLQECTTDLQTTLDDSTRALTEVTQTLTQQWDEQFPSLRNELYEDIEARTNALEKRIRDALEESTHPLTERTAALESALDTDLPALETDLRSAVHESESRVRRALTDETETLEQRLTESVGEKVDQAKTRITGLDKTITELRSAVHESESRMRRALTDETETLEQRLTESVDEKVDQTKARITGLDKTILAKVRTELGSMKARYDSKAQSLRQDVDDQLLTLRAQVRSPPVASETRKGIVQLATQSEVNDGRNNNNAVTPQTLCQFLACHRSQISAEIDEVQRSIPTIRPFPARASGYQLLPSGLLIQWGSLSSSSASARRVQFPVSFSYACYSLSCISCHTIPQPVSVDNVTLRGFKIYGDGNYWMAIGC